jgi:uncharacterized LabA/DUF88 family protein
MSGLVLPKEALLRRVAIFIDGGYLDKLLRNEFGGIRINYEKFSDEILAQIHPDAYLLRTYYYHCLPYQSNPPTQEESKRFSSMQSFLSSINRLPRFEVKLGRLARRGPDENGHYFFEQKMVDVLLSIDLVRLSARGQITDIALVAGDSDFVPAIEVAKNEGVSAWLYHGNRPHNALWEASDERIKITQNLINQILWQS